MRMTPHKFWLAVKESNPFFKGHGLACGLHTLSATELAFKPSA